MRELATRTAKLFGRVWGPLPRWVLADVVGQVLEVVLGGLIAVGLFNRPAPSLASGMMAVAHFWMHFPARVAI